MTEQSMVERIARAMYDWEAEINDIPQRWKSVPQRAREEWHAMARAVLAAMREPSKAMIRAADLIDDYDPDEGTTNRDGEDHWRAMIDEALK